MRCSHTIKTFVASPNGGMDELVGVKGGVWSLVGVGIGEITLS